ncbi:DUF6301 family protein [Actinomadura rugatobispora]|uniref:DUF6301 family protein n=1 Tax=Actinomadura rugatobispora TaxID=1994 RepID=A0ABW0ZS40_9ACTN|nr:hypothetical protein GCM10010200_027930 [Actinomadura rugatobispora]
MTDLERLSDQEIAEAARRLRDLEWPRDRADVDKIADVFGWRVESRRETVARLGTRFGRATGRFTFEEGRAVRVTAAVSSFVDEESAEERARLQDAFAGMTAAVSGALGEPTRRLPGGNPEVRWRGERSTVSLHRLSRIVNIALATNEHVDEHDWAVSQGL